MKNETDNNKRFEIRKSAAKRAGLKSTLVIDDQVVMTSFGKGNKSVIENRIHKPEITQINPNKVLDVSIEEELKKYHIVGNGKIEALVDDPLFSERNGGADDIGLNKALEKEYFGSEDIKDNIHIQIIYNILDIDKLLAVHINNIIYELNNLRRDEDGDTADLFEYLTAINSFDEYSSPQDHGKEPNLCIKFQNNKKLFDSYIKNKRLYYFPAAFCEPVSDRDRKDARQALRSPKDIYYILGLLGGLRNYSIHDEKRSSDWLRKFDSRKKDGNTAVREAKDLLDRLYKEKVTTLDKDFVKNNCKTNIGILVKAYSADSDGKKKALFEELYHFIMLKSFKNSGFSVKKIRENILALNEMKYLNDKEFDSCRSKLYQLMDFVINKYYEDHKEKGDILIAKLRTSEKNDKKDEIYANEATLLFPLIRPQLNTVTSSIRRIKNKQIADIEVRPNDPDYALYKQTAESIRISKQNVHYFSKQMYLVSLLQDGKEINDLLTGLINKFENIAGFIEVLSSIGMDCSFTEDYELFKDSQSIANELRMINAFTRMGNPAPGAKEALFRDAATLLGARISDEEIRASLNLDKPGRGADHNFRNFIINNVIESSRFRYLIKYGDPAELRKLAENKQVIRFVLNGVPDEQIARYYSSCRNEEMKDADAARGYLADEIRNVRFDSFKNVDNRANAGLPNGRGREKLSKQTVLSLYLTVLYLITKNLVYINSRYTLAFHCLERDAHLLGIKNVKNNYCRLTGTAISKKRESIEERFNSIENPRRRHRSDRYNKLRACDYIEEDIRNSDNSLINLFRNNVAHMTAVRRAGDYVSDCRRFRSYYELYHYIMQRVISDSEKGLINNVYIKGKLRETKEKGGYSKDLVKAYCVPFGYNLARFKALSMEELFDRNNMGGKKGGRS